MGATSANGKDSVSANRRVVFVDPDDENALWWWPALVVPPKEFQQFRQTMGIEIEEPKDGEYLVCYFEDGSSSVVPEGAAMPFCPTKPPYTTYSNGRNGPAFLEDNAVRLATEYWTNGTAPPSFIWLHVANGSGSISKAVAPQSISKRRPSISLQSRQSSAEKEGASSVSIKPSGRHQGDAPPPKKSKKDHSHGHSSESARREKEKERDKVCPKSFAHSLTPQLEPQVQKCKPGSSIVRVVKEVEP
ncbi:hypothetical protein DFJ73DRAFT_70035 [Zopfochytrium polystomum]|nr:hypothetical protein DFJ73DRAFT_70035 [Zopfochytrium polystomum]